MKFALIALIAAVSAVNVRYTYEDIREQELKCKADRNREWKYDAATNTWACPLQSYNWGWSIINYDKLYKTWFESTSDGEWIGSRVSGGCNWRKFCKLIINTIWSNPNSCVWCIPSKQNMFRPLTNVLFKGRLCRKFSIYVLRKEK